MAAFEAQLQADPDGRLRNHAQRWQATTGQPVSLWAVHRACRALDWTHKKKLTASERDEAERAGWRRYDGLWVLRTNTVYEAETVAPVYKTLWTVEQSFRTAKSILKTRPIYHQSDEAIRGHVFCSFLALTLKAELERRLKQAEAVGEWAQVLLSRWSRSSKAKWKRPVRGRCPKSCWPRRASVPDGRARSPVA